mmetsp:Transcript_81439/g.161689  ORF Transcript_81439/g.161689 Transcript_81439/m.161689 type:complete len:114 (+) Transcript_81439:1275-1616(+)
MAIHMEGLDIKVSLDLIKFKGNADEERSVVRERPMPRCVGGDSKLTPALLKRLNATFFCNRKPIEFLGCSKKEKIKGTIEDMGKPLALKQGEAVKELKLMDRGVDFDLRPITF